MPKPNVDSRIDLVELPSAEKLETHNQGSPAITADEYAPEQVSSGKNISLHFSLALVSGEQIDSCFDKAPASFVLGDGSMLEGFEQKLLGMRAGESCEHVIPPEQAFGELREANIQKFPRFRFPADLVLSPGLMMDFSDVNGGSLTGVVKEFTSAEVSVDFNHPLAGKSIKFCAKIVRVGVSA